MSTAIDPQVVEPQEFTSIEDYAFSGNSVTVDNKRRFVEAYRIKGTVYHAAKAVGIARLTVYRYMESDPQFAEAVADSKEDSVDDLETSVYERAFSDNLLAMFYLKAHRPKFRDKVTIDVAAVDEEIKRRLEQLQGSSALTQPSIQTLQIAPPPDEIQKEADGRLSTSSMDHGE